MRIGSRVRAWLLNVLLNVDISMESHARDDTASHTLHFFAAQPAALWLQCGPFFLFNTDLYLVLTARSSVPLTSDL